MPEFFLNVNVLKELLQTANKENRNGERIVIFSDYKLARKFIKQLKALMKDDNDIEQIAQAKIRTSEKSDNNNNPQTVMVVLTEAEHVALKPYYPTEKTLIPNRIAERKPINKGYLSEVLHKEFDKYLDKITEILNNEKDPTNKNYIKLVKIKQQINNIINLADATESIFDNVNNARNHTEIVWRKARYSEYTTFEVDNFVSEKNISQLTHYLSTNKLRDKWKESGGISIYPLKQLKPIYEKLLELREENATFLSAKGSGSQSPSYAINEGVRTAAKNINSAVGNIISLIIETASDRMEAAFDIKNIMFLGEFEDLILVAYDLLVKWYGIDKVAGKDGYSHVQKRMAEMDDEILEFFTKVFYDEQIKNTRLAKKKINLQNFFDHFKINRLNLHPVLLSTKQGEVVCYFSSALQNLQEKFEGPLSDFIGSTVNLMKISYFLTFFGANPIINLTIKTSITLLPIYTALLVRLNKEISKIQNEITTKDKKYPPAFLKEITNWRNLLQGQYESYFNQMHLFIEVYVNRQFNAQEKENDNLADYFVNLTQMFKSIMMHGQYCLPEASKNDFQLTIQQVLHKIMKQLILDFFAKVLDNRYFKMGNYIAAFSVEKEIRIVSDFCKNFTAYQVLITPFEMLLGILLARRFPSKDFFRTNIEIIRKIAKQDGSIDFDHKTYKLEKVLVHQYIKPQLLNMSTSICESALATIQYLELKTYNTLIDPSNTGTTEAIAFVEQVLEGQISLNSSGIKEKLNLAYLQIAVSRATDKESKNAELVKLGKRLTYFLDKYMGDTDTVTEVIGALSPFHEKVEYYFRRMKYIINHRRYDEFDETIWRSRFLHFKELNEKVEKFLTEQPLSSEDSQFLEKLVNCSLMDEAIIGNQLALAFYHDLDTLCQFFHNIISNHVALPLHSEKIVSDKLYARKQSMHKMHFNLEKFERNNRLVVLGKVLDALISAISNYQLNLHDSDLLYVLRTFVSVLDNFFKNFVEKLSTDNRADKFTLLIKNCEKITEMLNRFDSVVSVKIKEGLGLLALSVGKNLQPTNEGLFIIKIQIEAALYNIDYQLYTVMAALFFGRGVYESSFDINVLIASPPSKSDEKFKISTDPVKLREYAERVASAITKIIGSIYAKERCTDLYYKFVIQLLNKFGIYFTEEMYYEIYKASLKTNFLRLAMYIETFITPCHMPKQLMSLLHTIASTEDNKELTTIINQGVIQSQKNNIQFIFRDNSTAIKFTQLLNNLSNETENLSKGLRRVELLEVSNDPAQQIYTLYLVHVSNDEYKILQTKVSSLQWLLPRRIMPLDTRNYEGLSAFHTAAIHGCLHNMYEFVRFGFDFNCVDSLGKTPLHKAAEEGRKFSIYFLMALGVDKMKLDNNKNKAINYIPQTLPDYKLLTSSLEDGFPSNLTFCEIYGSSDLSYIARCIEEFVGFFEQMIINTYLPHIFDNKEFKFLLENIKFIETELDKFSPRLSDKIVRFKKLNSYYIQMTLNIKSFLTFVDNGSFDEANMLFKNIIVLCNKSGCDYFYSYFFHKFSTITDVLYYNNLVDFLQSNNRKKASPADTSFLIDKIRMHCYKILPHIIRYYCAFAVQLFFAFAKQTQPHDGNTFLHYLAENMGDTWKSIPDGIKRNLIELFSDKCNSQGFTPKHIAAACNNESMLSDIFTIKRTASYLSHGAKTVSNDNNNTSNINWEQSLYSPFHLAVINFSDKSLMGMLGRGENKNIKGPLGKTALHLAIMCHNINAMRTLYADDTKEVQDNFGNTSAYYLKEYHGVTEFSESFGFS